MVDTVERTATYHCRVFEPVLRSPAFLKAPRAALLVYMHLCLYADRTANIVTPIQDRSVARRLQRDTGLSERSVRNGLEYLVKSGLISVERRSIDRHGRVYRGTEAVRKGWAVSAHYRIWDDGPREVQTCPECGQIDHLEPDPALCHRYVPRKWRTTDPTEGPQPEPPGNAPPESADDAATTALQDPAHRDDAVTTALQNPAEGPVQDLAEGAVQEPAQLSQIPLRSPSDPPLKSPPRGTYDEDQVQWLLEAWLKPADAVDPTGRHWQAAAAPDVEFVRQTLTAMRQQPSYGGSTRRRTLVASLREAARRHQESNSRAPVASNEPASGLEVRSANQGPWAPLTATLDPLDPVDAELAQKLIQAHDLDAVYASIDLAAERAWAALPLEVQAAQRDDVLALLHDLDLDEPTLATALRGWLLRDLRERRWPHLTEAALVRCLHAR